MVGWVGGNLNLQDVIKYTDFFSEGFPYLIISIHVEKFINIYLPFDLIMFDFMAENVNDVF